MNTVHGKRALTARGPLDSSGLREFGSSQTTLVFLVTIGVLTLPTRLQATDWIQSIHDANIDSIVFLTSIGKFKNGVSETLNGTGFIVHQSGYVLTCNHVFPDKPEYVSVERTAVIGGRYGTALPIKIIRRDEQADLMLLKLPQGKPWRSVKSAAEARVGSDVVAFGFPTDMEMVDTPGSITGVDSDGRWLTSAGLNHGMSGGPAFDRSGAVIGIVQGGHEELKALDLLTPISFATSLLQSVNSPLVTSNSGPSPTAMLKESPSAPAKPQEPLSEDLAATLDSVKVLSDRSLEVYVNFRNNADAEMAVYIGNPSGQWTRPTQQGLEVSITDNSGIVYWMSSIEGVTRLAPESSDPHRLYDSVNQFVIIPPKGDAQVRFTFWPKPYPQQPATSISLRAELRVLTNLRQKRTFDKLLSFPNFKIDSESNADAAPEISNSISTASRTRTLNGDVTATLESIKVLHDKSIEILVKFENSAAAEVAVYLGNPSGQWTRPSQQGLAAVLTDNSGSVYFSMSLEGLTRLTDASVDAHRIYEGVNQYLKVPAKGDAQVRFLFWPKPFPPMPASLINFTAECRVLTDLKSRRVFDVTLNLINCRVD